MKSLLVLWLAAGMVFADLTGAELLDSLLVGYDSSKSPAQVLGQSFQTVSFGLEIEHIFSFVEGGNHFNMIFGFTLEWTDDRLEFTSNSSLEFLVAKDEQLKSVWHPNMEIRNLLENEEIIVEELLIYSDGTVKYVHILAGYLACNYNFELIPYDSHTCQIEFLSLNSASTPLNIVLANFNPDSSKGIYLNPEIYLPEWEITYTSLNPTSLSIVNRQYSGITADISVDRRQAYSTFFIVVPGVLIVALSYSSFWIDYRASPSRTTLAVITILISLTQLYSTFRDYPKIGYNTWLLQFLYINALFTFIAMLEYVVVNRLSV